MGVFNSIGKHASGAVSWVVGLIPKAALNIVKAPFKIFNKLPKGMKKTLAIPAIAIGGLLAGDALLRKEEHHEPIVQGMGYPMGYSPYGDTFGYQDYYNPMSPNYNPGTIGMYPQFAAPCPPPVCTPRISSASIPRYHSSLNPFNY